jgi:hypothetical protein
MIVDMSDCILEVSEGATPVDLVRPIKTEMVGGMAQPPNFEDLGPIDISFQPVTQSDLKLLPEGATVEGTVKGYTSVALFTSQASECKLPDRLLTNGVQYLVKRVDDWMGVANYYRIFATRMGQ